MNHSTKSVLSVKEIAYVALFAAMMAICSWISIPSTVPFTLQTFAVFLAVTVLGGKLGTLSVLVYILLGAVGAPVFAGFQGGIGILLGNTGGYILGFIFSALVMWLMVHCFGKRALLPSMVVGLLLCYAFGTAWFMVVYAKSSGPIGLVTALSWCVFPFIVPDLVKIVLAYTLGKRLAPFCKL